MDGSPIFLILRMESEPRVCFFLNEHWDIKPGWEEKQNFKLCALKSVNSYAVWNTHRKYKLCIFSAFYFGGYYFFLAQFGRWRSIKERIVHSDNLRSLFFFFPKGKKPLSVQNFLWWAYEGPWKQQQCALQWQEPLQQQEWVSCNLSGDFSTQGGSES